MLYDKKMMKLVQDNLGNLFQGLLPDDGNTGKLDAQKLRKAVPCYLRLQELRKKRWNANEPAPKNQNSPPTPPDLELEKQLNNTCTGTVDGQSISETASPKPALDRKTVLALDFISQMSLNAITVVVDGVMSVETALLTPKIDAVQFDKLSSGKDGRTPEFWAAAGERKGSIEGAYLTGGQVNIAEAKDLGMEVKTIPEGSSDQKLLFSITLSKPVPVGTKLHITVTKLKGESNASDNAGANAVTSLEYIYTVEYTLTEK